MIIIYTIAVMVVSFIAGALFAYDSCHEHAERVIKENKKESEDL